MEEEPSADAVAAEVELILLQALTQSVAAKVDGVCSRLVEARRHLQEVARLSEEILAQVQPPNPVHADAAEIHARALALLRLPSLSLLDY
jgi:hypothetical protein